MKKTVKGLCREDEANLRKANYSIKENASYPSTNSADNNATMAGRCQGSIAFSSLFLKEICRKNKITACPERSQRIVVCLISRS